MLLREELLLLLRLAELLRFDELLETLDELLRLDELFRLDEPLDTFDELFRFDELVRAVLVALLFLLLSLRDTLLLLLREVLLPLLRFALLLVLLLVLVRVTLPPLLLSLLLREELLLREVLLLLREALLLREVLPPFSLLRTSPVVLVLRVEASAELLVRVELEVRVGVSDVTAVRRFSSELTFTLRLLVSREGTFTKPSLRSRRLFS